MPASSRAESVAVPPGGKAPEARAFGSDVKSLDQVEQQKPETVVAPGGKPPEARPFTEGFSSMSEKPDKSDNKEKAKTGPRAVNHEPQVEIWLPPEFRSSERKWPLLVFSHGFGGCAKQSTFLTKYLADHGYIVVAPDHADADCRARLDMLGYSRAGTLDRPEQPFRLPQNWDDKTESDRRDDIEETIASMLDDPQYKNYVDADRIGLLGHSLGGYTVLGLAGAWPSWHDKRIKCVLAMAPYDAPFLLKGNLSRLNVPVMYQSGSADKMISALLMRRSYDDTPSPKYWMELNGADHFAWTDLQTRYQVVIETTALEFFDKYLKGQGADIAPPKIKNGQTNLVKTFLTGEKSGIEP